MSTLHRQHQMQAERMLDSVARLSLAACDIGSLTTLSEMTKKELHAPVFQALGHCNCSNEPILAICEKKLDFKKGKRQLHSERRVSCCEGIDSS